MSCPRPGEKCFEFMCGSSIEGYCTQSNGKKNKMKKRIFLVKEPDDCNRINELCEKLDKQGEEYEIEYDDSLCEANCFGYVVTVEW